MYFGAKGIDISQYEVAEFVTALLRGTCSKLEYQIKNDDLHQASVQRFLISLVRVVHDSLLIINHSRSYQQYDYAWLGIDTIQMFTHLAAMSDAQKNTKNSSESISNSGQGHEKNKNESSQESSVDEAAKKLVQQSDILRSQVLPEIERWCALLIAAEHLIPHYGINMNDARGHYILGKVRCAAHSLLSLARLGQMFLDQKDGSLLRRALGAAFILHVAHTIYLLFCGSEAGLVGGVAFVRQPMGVGFGNNVDGYPVEQNRDGHDGSDSDSSDDDLADVRARSFDEDQPAAQEPNPFWGLFGRAWINNTYTIAHNNTDAGDCAICSEALASHEHPMNERDAGDSRYSENALNTVVRTPCNHQFHQICIDRWLREGANSNCPNCRAHL